MNKVDVRGKVWEIAEKVLGMPVPAEGLHRSRTPQWDSLNHVELVFLVEDAFDVVLDVEDVGSLEDLQSFVEAVERSTP